MRKIFERIFGDPNKKYLKKVKGVIKKINELEKEMEKLSDSAIKERAQVLKEKVRAKRSIEEIERELKEILPEAFALCREAAKRTLGQRHYDVQLIGGIVLHEGKIAEMLTGEGKTLAATLASFLNALSGKGVHIVTVNDYLARRDTVWMGQIYHFLGLSVGCLNTNQSFLYDPSYKKPDQEKDRIRDELGSFKVVEDFLRPCERKEAYLADITYGTNNEFGFDYLRDNMIYELSKVVQRELNYAILDEIDSILIDEARTPLIISQADFEASRLYKEFAKIIPKLKPEKDYQLDEKAKSVALTEEGIDKIEKFLGLTNIYQQKGIIFLHHLEQALRAHVFFKRDRDYIVKDGKVIIVDEFTGRLLPGRRYSGGLHQAIEAKEGVEVQPESKTLATISFQNYFRLYRKLAGMTGTAKTSAEEFEKVYGLEVISIPPNKPLIRKDLPDKVFKTERGKFLAIVEEVKKRHKKGQPILVGTNSIEKNEYLSKLLEREGIPHQVLNAKHHEREGQIIAQAGRFGAVTVATNMAGRGVDIVLGGNPPDPQEAKKVRELGGLHVIGAQRHEARRIDNQLRGRAGRQGDPGSSQFFVSLEDDLLRIFGGEKVKKLMEILKIPEQEAIEIKMVSNLIEKAQARVEGINFDLRSHLLKYDDVLNKHRQAIYKKRREILRKNLAELKEYILKIIEEQIELLLEDFSEKGKIEKFKDELRTILPLEQELLEKIEKIFKNYFDFQKKREKLKEVILKKAKDLLEEKEKIEGKENLKRVILFVILGTIDTLWSDQLEIMEHLRDSVRLRSFGGRDPLIEYQTEGYRIFKELQKAISYQVARTIFKVSFKENF